MLYNVIEMQLFGMRIGLHYSREVKVKGLQYLNMFDIFIIMALLLIAGVER